MMQQHTPPPDLNETDGFTIAKQFLAGLFAQLKKDIVPEDPEYGHILNIISLMEKNPEERPQVQPAPLTGPLKEFWKQAMGEASGKETDALVSHILNLGLFSAWINSTHYREHLLLDTVKDFYTCFEVVGPHGFFQHDRVTIGVMLMGPDFYYPSHSHPDAECIFALSGRATWHLDNGPIISIPAGTRIFIPSDTPHIFWSMEKPFAAIYLCIKD